MKRDDDPHLRPAATAQVDVPPVVEVRRLRRVFGSRSVLDGVDLTLRRGEFVALLGASGTGKSTLLRILAGLDAGAAGQVSVAPRRAVMFQDARLLPWRSVFRNVTLGLRGRDREALALLAEVGLGPSFASRWPRALSGGEAQRVALARALVRSPDLLLLDEPFGALDALTRIKMQQLLSQLHALHGSAVLLVTHDVEEAVVLADRVLVLRDGQLSSDVRVGMPRPRNRSHPEVVALRHRLLNELGVYETSYPVTEAT